MKFKYGDKVRVISGFYEGLNGTVIAIDPSFLFGSSYYVDMITIQNGTMKTFPYWIEEKELDCVKYRF